MVQTNCMYRYLCFSSSYSYERFLWEKKKRLVFQICVHKLCNEHSMNIAFLWIFEYKQ